MRPRASKGLSVPLEVRRNDCKVSPGALGPRQATQETRSTPAHGADTKLAALETVAELDEIILHVSDEVVEDGAQLDDGRELVVERFGLGLGLSLAIEGRTLLLGGPLLLGLL